MNPQSVVVLDEAGLASTTTLKAVLERVERTGARTVLVGDVHQYESVEAGRGFAQLQQGGMRTAHLTQMVRQRDATLAAAARASLDNPERTLQLVKTVEEANPAGRHQHIAEAFGSLTDAQRARTLVLTGTHDARRSINERIREQVNLSGSGQHIEVFRALDRTAAQKKDARGYEPGLTIRFEKTYRSLGVRRGEMVRVERTRGDAVVIALPDGTRRTMSPERLSGKGWSLGTVEQLEVAAGERIRFTGTDPRTGFKNGERGVVEEIRPDSISVRRENGHLVTIRRDRPSSLDYSYAVTGHSAQGLGADRVLIDKDTRSLTTNRRSLYTDVTRAREAAIVMTDSVQRLSRAAAVGPQKAAAMDVAASHISNGLAREHGD